MNNVDVWMSTLIEEHDIPCLGHGISCICLSCFHPPFGENAWQYFHSFPLLVSLGIYHLSRSVKNSNCPSACLSGSCRGAPCIVLEHWAQRGASSQNLPFIFNIWQKKIACRQETWAGSLALPCLTVWP